MTERIATAVAALRAWGEAHDWRGYDPYDALNSPLARPLTLGTSFGARLLTQGVKLAPINVRPVLRIKPDWNAKALVLVASGYARLGAAGDREAAEQARRWLSWLVANHTGGRRASAGAATSTSGHGSSGTPRGTPNAIATSFAGQALLDGCELLGEDRWRGPAQRVGHFLVRQLLCQNGDAAYFRYLPRENELVHNANLLACAVLARASRTLDDPAMAEPALAALATSLGAQREDGAWPYAEGPGHDWVDNFHTGYVLQALAQCVSLEPTLVERVRRGIDFWDRELFLADGTPKYDVDNVLPLDAHGLATAIDTWLAVVQWREEALERATRLADLLVDGMLDPRGFVHFQRRRLWTSRVPFVRWTTAPTFCALAGLLLAEDNAGRG